MRTVTALINLVVRVVILAVVIIGAAFMLTANDRPLSNKIIHPFTNDSEYALQQMGIAPTQAHKIDKTVQDAGRGAVKTVNQATKKVVELVSK
jgi:hypothetical protein